MSDRYPGDEMPASEPVSAPEPTPEERLAAVKAKRRALLEGFAAEEAAKAVTDALALEERALSDETAIAAARKKYGKGKYVVIRDIGAKDFDVVVLKRAHAAAFKAFQDKDAFKLDDVEELVTPCVEYPAVSAFSKLITHDAPMVLTRCAEGVAWLAGMRKSVDLGKA
jgi:hypothetical protein